MFSDEIFTFIFQLFFSFEVFRKRNKFVLLTIRKIEVTGLSGYNNIIFINYVY